MFVPEGGGFMMPGPKSLMMSPLGTVMACSDMLAIFSVGHWVLMMIGGVRPASAICPLSVWRRYDGGKVDALHGRSLPGAGRLGR